MKKVYEETIKVYDSLGKKYLEDSMKVVPIERENFLKSIPEKSRILDVGCGGGRDSKVFYQNGHHVVGIDLSKVMLRQARKRVPQARFVCMDVTKVDFPASSFDGIWAEAVLLHLKRTDVPKVLKRFYKILKPGGLIHIYVKRGKGESYVKEELSGWKERFYTYFNKKEIVQTIKDAGFKIVHTAINADSHGRKDVKWICVWGRK